MSMTWDFDEKTVTWRSVAKVLFNDVRPVWVVSVDRAGRFTVDDSSPCLVAAIGRPAHFPTFESAARNCEAAEQEIIAAQGLLEKMKSA